MTDQTLRSERLYERIVDQIGSRILAAELKLGEPLPPERHLAEQFGVSCTATAARNAMRAHLQVRRDVEATSGKRNEFKGETKRHG